ncbi:MAG: hypothetical protein U5R31_15915 [Acidimicrobiia bacterium]|nr:hypothetical protein [Acidimicrobiia bacterium]
MDNAGAVEGPYLVLGLIWFVVAIYCAYLSAKKGHWILFILGFFCGGLFWVIGAILPDSRRTY